MFEKLTAAAAHVKESVSLLRSGRKFGAMSEAGKAVDLLGQAGAEATGENAEATGFLATESVAVLNAVDSAAGRSFNSDPLKEIENLATRAEQCCSEDDSVRMLAVGSSEMATMGPIAQRLLMLAVQQLLKRLFA